MIEKLTQSKWHYDGLIDKIDELVDAVNEMTNNLGGLNQAVPESPVRDHAEDHKTMDEVVVCLTKQEIRDLLDGYTGNAKLRKAWEAMK